MKTAPSGNAGNNNNKFHEQLLLTSKARYCGLFFERKEMVRRRDVIMCQIFDLRPLQEFAMSKAQDSKKETKKEPAKTTKEKKEAKKIKKEARK
jgi:hypothetical protein